MEKQPKKISIITINLNNREGLEKTIHSVETQVFKDFEWIMVDGASTDGSKEVVEQHRDLFTSWISEPDTGIYNAMNKGIRMAHGDYLLFLNSGDCLLDDKVLERTIPYLGETDYVIGNIAYGKPDNVTDLCEKSFDIGHRLYILIHNYSYPHQASFMRRALFDEYGYYREDLRIVSDWVHMLDSLLLGRATVKYLPLVVTLFDPNGISNVRREENAKERKQVLQERPILTLSQKLLDFHLENYEMVNAMKGNKFFLWLFRIFFYFWRKSGKHAHTILTDN